MSERVMARGPRSTFAIKENLCLFTLNNVSFSTGMPKTYFEFVLDNLKEMMIIVSTQIAKVEQSI